MLTDNDLKRLKRLVDLAPYLDKELQEKLQKLIADLKVAEAKGSILPQSVVAEMTAAVPDKLMAEIVQDFRHGVASPSGLLKSESRPVQRGTGWVEPPRTRDRTTEFKIFDQMVAAMAGGPNDCSKLK